MRELKARVPNKETLPILLFKGYRLLLFHVVVLKSTFLMCGHSALHGNSEVQADDGFAASSR